MDETMRCPIRALRRQPEKSCFAKTSKNSEGTRTTRKRVHFTGAVDASAAKANATPPREHRSSLLILATSPHLRTNPPFPLHSPYLHARLTEGNTNRSSYEISYSCLVLQERGCVLFSLRVALGARCSGPCLSQIQCAKGTQTPS